MSIRCWLGFHKDKKKFVHLAFNPDWRMDSIVGAEITSWGCSCGRGGMIRFWEYDNYQMVIKDDDTDEKAVAYLEHWTNLKYGEEREVEEKSLGEK